MSQLEQDLTAAMGQALNEKPRGKQSEADYAGAVLAALAVSALKRAEQQQAAKMFEYAAKQALVEQNTRYWLVNHYAGLRTSLLRGEEDAWCRWAGLRRRDFNKLAAGEQQLVNDWTADTVLPRFGAQLVAPFRPPAKQPGDFELKESPFARGGGHGPDPRDIRPVKALVTVDWRQLDMAAAQRYAEQQRKGPTVAVMAAPEF